MVPAVSLIFVRCPVCHGSVEAGRCGSCGSGVVSTGDAPPRIHLVEVKRESVAVQPPSAQAVASLLLLPGVSEPEARRLASAGLALGEVLAMALPEHAVSRGLHRRMVVSLSAPLGKLEPISFPRMEPCSVCGSAARAGGARCDACGAEIFEGESVQAIRLLLDQALGVVESLDDDLDYLTLPKDFRQEIQSLLGATVEVASPVPVPEALAEEPLVEAGDSKSRIEALQEMERRLRSLFSSLGGGEDDIGATLKPRRK